MLHNDLGKTKSFGQFENDFQESSKDMDFLKNAFEGTFKDEMIFKDILQIFHYCFEKKNRGLEWIF